MLRITALVAALVEVTSCHLLARHGTLVVGHIQTASYFYLMTAIWQNSLDLDRAGFTTILITQLRAAVTTRVGITAGIKAGLGIVVGRRMTPELADVTAG